MKLRIFGGTFDPIHGGHKLTIERSVQPDGTLIIAPTAQNPWKDRQATSLELRLQMIELVIATLGITASRTDLPLGGVHIYTTPYARSVEVLRDLRARFPQSLSLEWVVGPESAAEAPGWMNWQEEGCPLFLVPEIDPVHSKDVRANRELLLPELRNFADVHGLYR